ncbi:aminoacyl-tRNA deacylase [Parahaliea mediterranea]|uniref:YbaK/EbsC family protein n=1 Tax=Parahaliea mediterranea TaxID=651086 RepID=A0A939DEJ7_9GAMM|nr:YbaK/EbsC family protein [Parahaliea mediterranea]MBN7796746.1 YbaK/EbsC family protein [Parahaliea mediterranea]
MSLSPAIEHYLNTQHVPFELLEHSRSSTSLQSAHLAHVTPAQLAKAVVVRRRDQLLMCVLPASHQLMLEWLNNDYGGHYQLVSEQELAELFPDCDTGAIPPLGQAYGMKVVWDNSLRHTEHVYLEAGDHRHLVHLHKDDFMYLMATQDRATISCAADTVEYYRHVH